MKVSSHLKLDLHKKDKEEVEAHKDLIEKKEVIKIIA